MDKTRRIVAWGLSVVLALGYLESGYQKIVMNEMVAEQFEAFGYSFAFARIIAVLEGLGAALLLVPRFVVYGAGLISVIMIGALYTHWSSGYGSPFHAQRNLALLILLAGLRWKDLYRLTEQPKDST